jgi:hypothetical protein
MMTSKAKIAVAGGLFLLFLFGGKAAAKPAPAKVPTPPPKPPVKPVKPKGGDAELSNGNFARFEGELEAGTYVRCTSSTGALLPDAACQLVRTEFPEITVPISALIRMTEGRVL